MTLQQLIGELQTLALAYPAETPVVVNVHNTRTLQIPSVTTSGTEAELFIVVEAQ